MDISSISKEYQVRELTEADVERIYKLSVSNPMFYEYCPPYVTKDSIFEDMKALPPGMTYQDKYYIGFFDTQELLAVMDLITNYPKKGTAYIGLFMVDREYQGKGIGSRILSECIGFLQEKGVERIQLAYAKGNPQSESFWKKNGFHETGREYENEGYIAVGMGYEIRNSLL